MNQDPNKVLPDVKLCRALYDPVTSIDQIVCRRLHCEHLDFKMFYTDRYCSGVLTVYYCKLNKKYPHASIFEIHDLPERCPRQFEHALDLGKRYKPLSIIGLLFKKIRDFRRKIYLTTRYK